MHARLGILVLAVAISVSAAPRADAQQTTSTPETSATPATPATSAAGPRLELTATAVRRPAVKDSADVGALIVQRRQNMGRPIALMIVGGSAVLLGAIIGGDAGTIFMIGGAVTGLIGLYQYLQ